MEISLNRKSSSNFRKSVNKKRQFRSSLDQQLLNKRSCESPIHFCFRNSNQASVRNTFKSKKNSVAQPSLKIKADKENKDKYHKLLNMNNRNSSGFATCTVSPNYKSKCSSIVALQKKYRQIQKYRFVYQIGFGGFGKVWKIVHKKTMKQFAMKQISKRRVIDKNNVQSVMNEKKILSFLDHPFLINMNKSFQDQSNLYLVMDYLRGADLRYHICYKEKFLQQEIKFIIASIIIGLEYIHKNNIIHRDIKPQNIVFQESGYVRITDFGIAKIKNNQSLAGKMQSSGTPGYMAPEILCKNSYSFQSDFFPLGVIVYQLINGKRPYQGKNRQQIREDILKRQAQIRPNQIPKNWDMSVVNFVNGLLQNNPENRLGVNGIKQIKSHPWMRDIKWKQMQKKEVKPPFRPNVVSETKQYLQQIVLYNQMNENKQFEFLISKEQNKLFEHYDFKKAQKKLKSKKMSQGVFTNSTNLLKTFAFNFFNQKQKKETTPSHNMKKKRRNSQGKIMI